MARSGGSGSIGLRLALAFIAVARLAVALLAGLTAASAAGDVAKLASQQRKELTQAMTAVAGAAWEEPGGGCKDDLGQVIAAGHSMGAEVQVTENTGRIVAASPGFSRGTLPVETAAVMVQGHRVGRIAVRLTGSGLPAADSVLRSALLRAIASPAGLAAVFALLTGLLAAPRITRPVTRRIEVTQAMGHGERPVLGRPRHPPAHVARVAASGDRNAGDEDPHDQLRPGGVGDRETAAARGLAPVTVRADAQRMAQVVATLLSTALKFTPAGGRVTLEAGPAGRDARLRVTATGTGIPPDELPRIFDRFWRGRPPAPVAGTPPRLPPGAPPVPPPHPPPRTTPPPPP